MLCLELEKYEDERTGTCKLNILFHLFDESSDDLRNDLLETTKKFIVDTAALQIEEHLEIMQIKVDFSNVPIKKLWAIREEL